MSLWRQITHGLRALTNSVRRDRDFADEFAHFVDETTTELVEQGMTPADARREARRRCGNALAVRDEVHASGWEHFVETLFADLRYGVRRLRQAPAFALASIVTLALGIGASTAIFSTVWPVLFERLPYPDANRLMAIWDYTRDGGRLEVTFGTFRELEARSRMFESLAVFRPWQPTVTGPAAAERLDGQRVSADYFRVLGITPALGRDFTAEDDVVNGPGVALLSDALWRSRFGADPGIVGRQITLDAVPYEVIGVIPRHFEHVVSAAAVIWAPLQYDKTLPEQGREWGHHLRMIGRVRRDAPLDAARSELNTIARTPLPDFPRAAWAALGNGLIVTPLQEDLTRAVQPALLAVLGAVLLVLAMSCVNVANLILARGMRRRAEFAMRATLGAGRVRLVRQVVTEGLLLATLGGVLGTALAMVMVRWVVALTPATLPRAEAIAVDGAALLFALSTTTVIGMAIGILPLRYTAPERMHAAVRGRTSQSAAGPSFASRAMVLLEVALALVLLVSAGLLVRTLNNLFSISPGFATERLLTMQVQASGRWFDREASQRFFESALDAVRDVPGVAAAGFSSQLPLSGDRNEFGATFERDAAAAANSSQPVFRYAISPGYFEALGIPLIRGRVLGEHDTEAAPNVTVVSESFARKFPGADPIGQRIYIGPTDGAPYTVVGIVGDVRQASLAEPDADAVYVTSRQWRLTDRAQWLVVRTHGAPAPLAATVRAAIASVDRDQPVVRVATMDQVLRASAGERHFALMLFQLFGVAALVLVATGVYGVIANSVEDRTREIGVRMALGASPRTVLRSIVSDGMAVTGGGLVIGLAGAAAASGALVKLLFDVSPLDPATYGCGVTLLILVSLAASGLPAWRASRVDPSITLRAE